jgi:alkaline phosphatase D
VPNDVDSVDAQKRWRSDSWPAFPKTRGQLLNAIVKHRVQNVIFLSGDIHVSCVARLRFLDAGHQELPVRAFSVVSSAFYWPFPFADGDPLSFVHDSAIEGDGFDLDDGVTMHYRAWNFEQNDNYTQVDVSDTALGVRHFDRSGRALGERVTLELAAP